MFPAYGSTITAAIDDKGSRSSRVTDGLASASSTRHGTAGKNLGT